MEEHGRAMEGPPSHSENHVTKHSCSEPAVSVFSPLRLGQLNLRNRVVRAGCFEGLCHGGLVTDRLIEHHRRVAEGGVAQKHNPTGMQSADHRTSSQS